MTRDDAAAIRTYYCPECGATMRPRPRPRIDRALELAYMIGLVVFFAVAIVTTWFR